MTEYNFDRIQEQQDKHSAEWQRQFVMHNEPHEPDSIHDYKGDLITESELWITEDGLVPFSYLIDYCKDKYDYLPNNVDEAIKMIGGHKYDHDIGLK